MTIPSSRSMKLADLCRDYAPGSFDPPWSWDDEAQHLWAFCPEKMASLKAFMTAHGFFQPVCLGTDGRLWDGHHRIVIARELGIEDVPIEDD